MQRTITLLPPTMPEFIYYDDGTTAKKQDGFNLDRNKIPIGNLSKEEAEQYGELMKQKFIEYWAEKQN